jgi:hypothetical protein
MTVPHDSDEAESNGLTKGCREFGGVEGTA